MKKKRWKKNKKINKRGVAKINDKIKEAQSDKGYSMQARNYPIRVTQLIHVHARPCGTLYKHTRFLMNLSVDARLENPEDERGCLLG